MKFGGWRVGSTGYAPWSAFELPTVRTSDGMHIAYVHARSEDDAEAIEIASLLSAAPDLLAALEKALAADPSWIASAQSAIKKARSG